MSQLSSINVLQKQVVHTHPTSAGGGNAAEISTMCPAFTVKSQTCGHFHKRARGPAKWPCAMAFRQERLSECVSVCMQPNLHKLAFIINFGPFRLEYITTKGQSNQCQKEHKKTPEDIWKSIFISSGGWSELSLRLRWISQTEISKINQVIMEAVFGGAVHFHSFRISDSNWRRGKPEQWKNIGEL